MRFGFAEDPDIPRCLERHASHALSVDPMATTFFASRETIVVTSGYGLPLWRDRLFAFLARNAQRATTYFAIPDNCLVEIGSRLEI